MNVNPTAIAVLDGCEAVGARHMVTGAFAFNCYGTTERWTTLLASLPPL